MMQLAEQIRCNYFFKIVFRDVYFSNGPIFLDVGKYGENDVFDELTVYLNNLFKKQSPFKNNNHILSDKIDQAPEHCPSAINSPTSNDAEHMLTNGRLATE